jgi:DNA-directed RNA polymerase specialized sigma subunit
MKEIGKVLGLSESRVSQMHAKILIKLRTQLKKAGRRAA